MKLVAAEAVFAYHTVFHRQSFHSMHYTIRIEQKLFESKFSCACTKAEAVVVNAPQFYPLWLRIL